MVQMMVNVRRDYQPKGILAMDFSKEIKMEERSEGTEAMTKKIATAHKSTYANNECVHQSLSHRATGLAAQARVDLTPAGALA